MRFGQPTKPHTKHYKKSFLVNIKNGKEYLALQRSAPLVGSQTQITWNEGWQIIPWSDLRAYLTPIDYFELTVMMRKWRIKAASVKLEGVIPFQVDLSGATNSTTATFNNRINLHYYMDDGELLPDIAGMDLQAHSDIFTVPWGEGTNNILKSPDFIFRAADQPSAYRYATDTGFNAAEPQKYFSLYNTGHVKSCYPGQKIFKKWVNPNTNWVGRAPNDSISKFIDVSASTAAQIDTDIFKACQQAYRSGFTGNSATLKSIPGAPTVLVAQKSNYLDTGLPIKFQGPPYFLIRVEPYPNLGTGGGLIDIYAQAHLHYELEIECFPLEKPMTYIPFRTGTAVAQGDADGFQNQLINDCVTGITDNKVHRAAGVSNNDAIYT